MCEKWSLFQEAADEEAETRGNRAVIHEVIRPTWQEGKC